MRTLRILALAGFCVLPEMAHAEPSELYMCEPVCRETWPPVYQGHSDCDLIVDFVAGDGRSLWGPLSNAGPVRIGVKAKPVDPPVETLPLIVQVRTGESGRSCPPFDEGVSVFQTEGKITAVCESLWVWSPVIVLENWGIPRGTVYWVQLVSEFRPEETASSPVRSCVKVEAATVGVEAIDWTRLKGVFRE